MPGGQESTAPSAKTMATVKNKNNVTELELSRTLTQLDKEKALSILLIDHERLDLRDFMRNVKLCASDDLPESKQLLQDKVPVSRKSSSSLSGRRKAENPPNTAPDKARPDSRDQSDVQEKGTFRTGGFQSQNKSSVHMDIYSRRNMYADLTWTEDYFANEGRGLGNRKSERSVSSASPSRQHSAAMSAGCSSRDSQSRVNSGVLSRLSNSGAGLYEGGTPDSEGRLKRPSRERRSSPTRRDARGARRPPGAERTSREGRGQSRDRPEQGDFMKELLVRNASHRYRRKRGKPLDERLKAFYNKVEDLLEKEEELTPIELERKWVLLTKGVKAALVYSSDEEEDQTNQHTI